MLKSILGAIMALIAMVAAVNITRSYDPAKLAETKNPAPNPIYQIGEYSGRLAVFRYKEKIPLEILDVHVDSLPEFDQNEVRKGIFVYSEPELQSLVEDYDS